MDKGVLGHDGGGPGIVSWLYADPAAVKMPAADQQRHEVGWRGAALLGEAGDQAPGLEDAFEQTERAAVRVVRDHGVVTRLRQTAQDRVLGGEAAGEGEAALPLLERAAAAGIDELSLPPGWAAASVFWSFVLGSFDCGSLAVLGSLAVAPLSAFTVASEDLADLAASASAWPPVAGP
jgi:hypothetical protein